MLAAEVEAEAPIEPDGRAYTEKEMAALVLDERRACRALRDDELTHYGRMARLCLERDAPPPWLAIWMRARIDAAAAEWRWRRAEHSPERDRSLRDWLDEAKRRVDLAEVIALPYPSRPNGRNQWQVRCPLHEDRSPSLSVDATAGLWWCFGCQVGGDVLKWWSLVDGLDWRACLDRLEAVSGLTRPAPPKVRPFVPVGLAVIRA